MEEIMSKEEIMQIPFGKDERMTDNWVDIMMMPTMAAPMMPVSQTLLVKLIDCIVIKWRNAKWHGADKIMNNDASLLRVGKLLDVLLSASPWNTKEQFSKDKPGSWWDYQDGYHNTFMEIMTGDM